MAMTAATTEPSQTWAYASTSTSSSSPSASPSASPMKGQSQAMMMRRQVPVQRLKLHRANKNPNDPVPNPMIVVAMLFSGIVVALLVMAFFAFAPLLCATWLFLTTLMGLYISTEAKSNWWWHDAQEFENRFWTATAFLFSAAMLYIEDSPFAIGRWSPTVGMMLVVSITTGVHFFDRFVHRKEISRKPRLKHSTSMSQNLFKYKATAEEKAQLVSQCVAYIDRLVLPSTLNNMFNSSLVKRQEQKIFRILAGASKEELNYIVNNVRLALLFYKVKDHSKERADQSRTLILELLCQIRLPELTVTSRAILLDALMVMRLSAHPQSEKWVRNIILKTTGDDLSNLKTFCDAKGNFHSLHKLIYGDIRDPANRNDILNHIKRQAGIQTAHMRLGTRSSAKRKTRAWRKVLSDVDDTLYSSGGRYPAGVDTRYPRHCLYPGVLSFYRELDMGTAGPDEWTEDRVGNLVFLSARPHVYKDVAEKKTYAQFAAMHEEMGMHTLPTLLAGSLQSGRAFMVQGDLEPMARKKFENFTAYYQLYPEFTHVFVGDNGQGDVRAAELIVEKHGSAALEAGFFHLVQPIYKTMGYKSRDDVEKWRRMNIVFFHTYVGAAVEAYKMKMIRLLGLKKICDEAVMKFVEINSWLTTRDRERARLQLNRDLESANEMLCPPFESVPLVHRPQTVPLHSKVRTPFGVGIIRDYRGLDGIYHVDLLGWDHLKRRRRAQGFFPEESIFLYSAPGDARNKIQFSPARYVSFHRAQLGALYTPQARVMTPFGIGRVLRFRKEDERYVVAMEAKPGAALVTGYFTIDVLSPAKLLPPSELTASPRIFAGVRSSLGSLAQGLIRLVPTGQGAQVAKPLFAMGATVETPFGRGLVLRMRFEDRVYEVQLLAHHAKNACALVQESSIQLSTMTSHRSLLEMLGWGGGSNKANALAEQIPLVEGSPVATPYGKGVVKQIRKKEGIFEVELFDWRLAHGSKVIAYLTQEYVCHVIPATEEMPPLTLDVSCDSIVVEAAPAGSGGNAFFKLFRFGGNAQPSGPYANEGANRRMQTDFGIGYTTMWSAYNGCYKIVLDDPRLSGVIAYVHEDRAVDLPPVSSTRHSIFGYLRGGWGASVPPQNPATPVSKPLPIQRFGIGALVTTPFGEGVVGAYQQPHDVYEVSILTLRGYFQASVLRHPLHGTLNQPVSTTLGSGILTAFRPEDGVHVVALRRQVMDTTVIRGYFQPVSILGSIRAARGDVVKTPYGSGVVVRYRVSDDFYCVAFEWGRLRQLPVLAYIRSQDIVRTGVAEKSSTGCAMM